jgi:phosphoglycerate dehydrogenase-like enzyme
VTLHCTVLDDYQGAALTSADWSVLAPGVEVTVLAEHLADEDQLVTALAAAEIVVVMRERTPVTASLLARLPALRLLVTSGMRNAAIDRAATVEHGVVVCGTRSNAQPPAELTWALVLGLARHLTEENAALRAGGPWQSTVGTDLHGATLGLLGLGRIGALVARVGLAFGMDVLAWSQHLTAARAEEVGVRLAGSKEQLLVDSDVVSVHLVLGDRTRGLIGAPELALMKPSALLVNTSRAAIVDRAALVTALREGRIAGAGLDVFDVEPLPADDELRTLPTVLATPHLGYVTQRNYTGFFTEAVEDIAAFLAGDPVRRLW